MRFWARFCDGVVCVESLAAVLVDVLGVVAAVEVIGGTRDIAAGCVVTLAAAAAAAASTEDRCTEVGGDCGADAGGDAGGCTCGVWRACALAVCPLFLPRFGFL